MPHEPSGAAPVLFDASLQLRDDPEQCAVRIMLNRVVAESVVHDRMFHNLLAETQFSAADVEELLQLLHSLAARGTPIAELCQRLRQFCAASAHGQPRPLRGRPAQLGQGPLGRVVTLRSFAHLLVHMEHHTDLEEAVSAIRAMLGTPPQDFPIDWQSYPLGRYAMWSTFDESGARPFHDTRSASDLLELLGLDPHHDGDLLLVFEYKLPAAVVSRVPSFCDAYVGSWNAWFRVSPHEAPFGRTRPVGEREARGVPEVIHEVVTASVLEAPLSFRA
jgi:hypothetical protein